MSPVSPFLILPGVCAYVSQIDGPLPSSFHAPSIWYADVATPHKKSFGKGCVDIGFPRRTIAFTCGPAARNLVSRKTVMPARQVQRIVMPRLPHLRLNLCDNFDFSTFRDHP